MNKIIILAVIVFLFFFLNETFSQNVGIGETFVNPDPSALLELQSSSRGFLLPRLTSIQRDNIITPAESLLIFNTDTKCLEIFVNNVWHSIWCQVVCTPSVPAQTISGLSNVCAGDTINLNVQGGTLGTGAWWYWYNGSCGGNLLGSGNTINIVVSSATTVYVRAEGDCGITDCISLQIDTLTSPDKPIETTHISGTDYIIWNWNLTSDATGYLVNTINDINNSIDIGYDSSFASTALNCESNYSLFIWAYNNCSVSEVLQVTFSTDICIDPCDGVNDYGYGTVSLGQQCWMAKNLNITSSNSWCYANNTSNCNIYGRLYRWDVAQNICPVGWKLPSDNDWKLLEIFLGMSQSDADAIDYRGTDEGDKIKSDFGWNSGGNGSNITGMTFLPAGNKHAFSVNYYHLGNYTFLWTATDSSSSDAFSRYMHFSSSMIGRGVYDKTYGFSVRCIIE